MGWYQRRVHGAYPEVCKTHEHLFKKYKVDLFISGHKHLYQRHTPLDKKNRPVHVGPGGPGCDETSWIMQHTKLIKSGKNKNYEYYVNGIDLSTGVMRVTRDKLSWQVLNSKTNYTMDYFEMDRFDYDEEDEEEVEMRS